VKGEEENPPHSLFVSDLHLCPSRPETAALFERFLDRVAPAADALYLLGDLFEYWAGDDDLAEPFHAAVVAALARLSRQGTALYLIRGNRDFLQGEAFAAACGGRFLADPTLIDLHGTPTLLAHGDRYCTDDADYQTFRARVRDPAWQAAFLARPLAERKQEIERLRAASETGKRAKPTRLMDVNPAAIAAALREAGCRRLIHGHTHRRARHALDLDGTPAERWVLGEWRATGDALRCDADGCVSVDFPGGVDS